MAKSSRDKRIQEEQQKVLVNEKIAHLKKDIQKLTYEDSLQLLDEIIVKMQDDNIPIEKLEESFLKGKVYLEHCESLLSNVEQRIVELDPQTLKEKQ